jgi:hypothetical protein
MFRSYSSSVAGLAHRIRLCSIISSIALCVLAPSTVRAQITFTLNPTIASGQPGDVLAFLATVTNVGTESLELSSAAGNISGPDAAALMWDDTQFLDVFSSPLTPSESRSETLFITISNTAAMGQYNASYDLEFLGLSTEFTYTGTAQAQVTVGASATAPEPATAALIAASMGLFALGGVTQRRGRRRCLADPISAGERIG